MDPADDNLKLHEIESEALANYAQEYQSVVGALSFMWVSSESRKMV